MSLLSRMFFEVTGFIVAITLVAQILAKLFIKNTDQEEEEEGEG